MKASFVEKLVPFTLIIVFALLIIVRLTGIFPMVISNFEQTNMQWVLAGSGIGGIAAIFAIVISMSLMAVQFASQEYSHRIMMNYMKSTTFWSMILIYTGTLIFNIYFTGSIENPGDGRIADVSVLLQILCILMIIPHFINTTSQLNPNYIINRILETVNKDYIASLAKYNVEERIDVPSDEDRILPVVEIVEKTIIKGDRDTTRATLSKLYDCYHAYTNNGKPVWLRRHFMDYCLRIGQQGVLSEDDNIVVRVVRIFSEIAMETQSDEAVEYAGILTAAALKKDYDVALQQALESLLTIMRASPSASITARLFSILNDLAIDLLNMGKIRITIYFVRQIAGLSNMITSAENSNITDKTADILEKIGLIATRRGLTEIIQSCITAFHKIGVASVEAGISENNILSSLLKIEQATPAKFREMQSQIDYVIQNITQKVQSKQPETTTASEPSGFDTSGLWDKDD